MLDIIKLHEEYNQFVDIVQVSIMLVLKEHHSASNMERIKENMGTS